MAGLLLGLIGVGLVVGEKLVATSSAVHAITSAGILAAVTALLGTTFGILYQRRFCASMSLTSGSAIQYIATSLVMLVAAWSFETMRCSGICR